MWKTRKLKVQQIDIKNATQRTVSIIGGKGAGKTTLMKMLIDQEYSILCLDPLNVIKGDFGENTYRIPIRKEDSERKILKIAHICNNLLTHRKNVILFFDEMLKEEMIQKIDILFPNLDFKDGYVFIDEIHEFAPLFNPSIELSRAVRHWRNRNIGFVLTTQRPASVNTSVIAMTDYLILFRITWKNDIEAVKELLKYQVTDKEDLNRILGKLQHFEFMEGYKIDFNPEFQK